MLTSKFVNVTIIIQDEDEELLYELPKVKDVVVDVKYEEPEIRADLRRITKAPEVLSFSISMKPLKVDGVLYTITKTTRE